MSASAREMPRELPSSKSARKVRTLLVLVLVAGVLFFGSILFILSRAPSP